MGGRAIRAEQEKFTTLSCTSGQFQSRLLAALLLGQEQNTVRAMGTMPGTRNAQLTEPNSKPCCLLGWVFERRIVPAWQALCEARLLLVSLCPRSPHLPAAIWNVELRSRRSRSSRTVSSQHTLQGRGVDLSNLLLHMQ